MMTDKQLQALLNCITAEAGQHSNYITTPEAEARQCRRELIKAFGFTTDRRARAVLVPGTADAAKATTDREPEDTSPAARAAKALVRLIETEGYRVLIGLDGQPVKLERRDSAPLVPCPQCQTMIYAWRDACTQCDWKRT